jgi:hypothetical protein
MEGARALALVAREVERALRGAVRRARRAGYSWAEVGEALGMTKQSAWERFADKER